jgi:hypothetical protein
MFSPSRMLGALIGSATLLATAAPAFATVKLRGTAYEFNNVEVRLAGATIRIAERPNLRATTRDNGTYALTVPDRARVTPYIEAEGYRSIHLQTFRTRGETLREVNFQTPTEAVANALAALLDVPTDESGAPRDCVIVSTFSTRNVRGVSFGAFTGYGAHGVAGATAHASPALPQPVYFNEHVIPDRSQELSSEDGGVIWTEVPAGVYRISASHPSTEFASFRATCAPGRIVNANPSWGLHELGLANRTQLSASWEEIPGAASRLRGLAARRLPPDARVRVRCLGRDCNFAPRKLRASGDRLDIGKDGLGQARRLRAGQRLEVRVAAPAHDAKVVRWRLREGRRPKARTLCVPLGLTLPRRSC